MGQRFGTAVAALLLYAAGAFAQETLTERAVVELPLSPGGSREFPLRVSGPTFLRLTLEQKTAPCRLVIDGPRGKVGEFASFDFSRIRTARILEQPGNYRVTVELAPAMSRAGNCSLAIDDFRSPQADDRAVAEAYGKFWGGDPDIHGPWANPVKSAALRSIIDTLQSSHDTDGGANALWLLAESQKPRPESESGYRRALALYHESGNVYGELVAEVGLAWQAQPWDPGTAQKVLARLAGRANDWLRSHLLWELGNLYSLREYGHSESALGFFSQGAELCRSTGDRSLLGRLLIRIASVHVDSALYDEAVTDLSEAIEILTALKEPARAKAVQDLARVYNLFLLDKQKALDVYRSELDRAGQTGDTQGMTVGLGNLASIYGSMGSYRDALDALLRLEQLENGQKGKAVDFALQSQIAAMRHALGDVEGAVAIRRRLASEFQKTMREDAVPPEWIRLSNFRRGAGDWEGARDAMEEALRRERKTANRFNEGAILGGLAEIADHSGNLAGAIEYAEQAYRATVRAGNRNALVLVGYPASLAELYLRAGDAGKALDAARDALHFTAQSKDREAEARMLFLAARCERALGRLDVAASDLEGALGNV
jgi:tetratricopeptide (TPR) repeat protein